MTSPTYKGYQIKSSADSVADIYGGYKIKVHNRDKIKIKASQVFITWLKTQQISFLFPLFLLQVKKKSYVL